MAFGAAIVNLDSPAIFQPLPSRLLENGSDERLSFTASEFAPKEKGGNDQISRTRIFDKMMNKGLCFCKL